MSWLPDNDPQCLERNTPETAIDLVIAPNMRDIGDFSVRRVLPAPKQRAVGPFVFFDHMGPATFGPGQALAVPPHPHIGLATLTYLYEGSIVHRDSLGFRQLIAPGAVNWMSAGRGIVHSERSPEHLLEETHALAGLQVWVALPKQHEQTAPSFVHYSVSSLPVLEEQGVSVRVVAGECFGLRSRLDTLSPLFYADIALAPGGRIKIDADYVERALYLVSGSVMIDGEEYEDKQMLVLKPGAEIIVSSHYGADLVAVGGEPLDGPRHVWWNFVASDRDLIEQAKEDWRNGQFGQVPGDSEYIPLPQ